MVEYRFGILWVRLIAASVALPAWSLTATASRGADTVAFGFNRDVRPILSDNCFACHGPDKAQRKGKFRLDDPESALSKGAIVPGKPDLSPLIQRINSTDPDEVMPPPEFHKKLTDAQRELLKRWIAQGAPFEPFWAYIPPRRPVVPTVKNSGWVRNPIDAFIFTGLAAKSLVPAPQADRATLLRRLSLDLTGLPPTPDEVRNFIEDKSVDAYEKQVDRLLASPHYGERMAVPWLDAVRFADTVGFHGDQNQNIFPYRDYVIDAFNSDKPFDQFTIEQLAGDLLPHPTTDQLVATGYNRLNMVTREGGAQPKEYLAKYAADRVRTLGSTWLGSTLACCECHDHKFDPFSTKDFYSLESFWADVKEWGVYADYGYTPNPDLRGFNNDSPFPPEIVVENRYLQKRQRDLLSRIDQISADALHQEEETPKARAHFEAWRQEVRVFLEGHPDGWANASALVSESAALGNAGSVKLDGKEDEAQQISFSVPPGTIAAIRLEALPGDLHQGSILRSGKKKESANVELVAAITSGAGAPAKPLDVAIADADKKDPQFSNGYRLPQIIPGGWAVASNQLTSPQTAIYILRRPVKAAADATLTITLKRNELARIRVSVSPVAPIPPVDPSFATELERALDAEGISSPLPRAYLLSSADNLDEMAKAQVLRLVVDVMDCRNGTSSTLITVAQSPRLMRVLHRGNWQDESGEIVEPSIPHFLPQPDAAGHRRLSRLDLAQWIVSPRNPLTARTVVNRLWKQFMGVGICNTVEDLGSQGDPPSNPELLDWLAVEFHDSGWDVKHIVKLIVMSSTYCESSDPPPALRAVDPMNRLAGAQMPRRLEAEFIRDNALAAAGLLNLTDIGGPGVFPYQPDGYYASIQFPSRSYIADADDRQYRRGIYMHWQRTFLHPMLANFDAPSREDSVCTRNVSNTPLQALTLLNDPEFVEAARVFAEHAIQSGSDDAGRLNFIYERALARAPRPKERDSLIAFLSDQRNYYGANPGDAQKLDDTGNAPLLPSVNQPELAAWTTVCRVVLNLHETITRY